MLLKVTLWKMWQGRLEPGLCHMQEFLIDGDERAVEIALQRRIAELHEAQERHNRTLGARGYTSSTERLEWEFTYRLAPQVANLSEGMY